MTEPRADGGQLEATANDDHPDLRQREPTGDPLDAQLHIDVDSAFKQELHDAVEDSDYYSVAAAVRGELREFIERERDDDLRADGSGHASTIAQLKTAKENGTAPDGMDLTVAHDCPEWPDRATVSVPVDEACEACGWTPGDDGGERR